jgi:hypothetical protein
LVVSSSNFKNSEYRLGVGNLVCFKILPSAEKAANKVLLPPTSIAKYITTSIRLSGPASNIYKTDITPYNRFNLL